MIEAQTIKGAVSGEQGIRGQMKDIPSLDKSLTRENFAADAKSTGDALAKKSDKGHTHSKKDITDFPVSMPASDVYDWAKEPTKPSYTADEVGARPSDWTPSADDVGAAPSGYGIGSPSKIVSSANQAVVGGIYFYTSNATDIPDGFGDGVIFAQNRGNTQIFQRITDINGKVAERIRQSGGVWGDWVRCDPSVFAPSVHEHTEYAPVVHGHTEYAPTGFGYGESLVGYSVETEAELETKLLEILNTMSNYTTKQVRINLGFLGVNTYYLTTIYKHTAVYSLVTFQTMRFVGASLLKVYANSTWNAICWENPPMNLGVEHRTTERWNGKAVYTKVFDFGALPNASSKTVAINIPTTFIVRADHVIHSSDGKVIQSPYFLADGTLVVKHLITGSGIQITTTADYSGYTATFQIWYTKEDWK
jgi:hypothetical protein